MSRNRVMDRFGKSYGDTPNKGYVEWAAQKAAGDVELAKLRQRAHLSRSRAWCKAEHKFRLKLGDTRLKTTAVMTGFEAVKRNKEFERKFIDAVAHDKPNVRLARWVLD